MISPAQIPENIRRCMKKEVRVELNAPTNPEIALKVEKRMEKDLHRSILQFLRMRGVFYVHYCPTNKKPTCPVGTVDFMFVYRGKPICFECKVGDNKLTKEQQETLLSMLRDGWRFCAEVRELAQVKWFLDQIDMELDDREVEKGTR